MLETTKCPRCGAEIEFGYEPFIEDGVTCATLLDDNNEEILECPHCGTDLYVIVEIQVHVVAASSTDPQHLVDYDQEQCLLAAKED